MGFDARMLIALMLLPVAACSTNPPPMATAPPPTLASADQMSINMAAAGDAAEIQAAQLAQAKAHRSAVKSYAAQMISDHTATTQQLSTIAQSKGVTPAATPSDSAQATMAKLEADKGAAFDRAYVRDQVMDHEKMARLTKTRSPTVKTPMSRRARSRRFQRSRSTCAKHGLCPAIALDRRRLLKMRPRAILASSS